MSIESLKAGLPDYARDLKLNLGSLASEQLLTAQQKAGSFLAAAFASRNATVTAALLAEFAPTLSPAALNGVKIAGAIMGMNNIYYRFVHLASAPEYGKLPARLRMNAMANPGVEKADFELWSIVVSAVNGCGMCIDSHEKVLREHGVTTEQIQAAVRIGAVVHAVAAVLDAEAAGAGAPAAAAA